MAENANFHALHLCCMDADRWAVFRLLLILFLIFTQKKGPREYEGNLVCWKIDRQIQ